jgi:hypothetical protein
LEAQSINRFGKQASLSPAEILKIEKSQERTTKKTTIIMTFPGNSNTNVSLSSPRTSRCSRWLAVILLTSQPEGTTGFQGVLRRSFFTTRTTGTSSSSSSRCFSTVRDNQETKSKTTEDEGAVLTDVDARVLQAMLREDKLALDEEENLRRLLERGIRAKEPTRRPPTLQDQEDNDEPSEYSSTVIKKLTNTKLWQAFQRNTADIVESAKIFIANRVERDSKLFAALGIFAFERAMKDVSRALPAGAAAKAKEVFRLSNTTSFQEGSGGSRSSQDNELFSDMLKPIDEFKSIQEDLQQIFASGGTLAGKASRRGLRTAAPAGMSKSKSRDRFARAYQRQQETTLSREKQNLAQTTGRAASAFVDTAWELKRELEVEPNEAGYRTKALREGAVKRAGLLKASAVKILEAVKRKEIPLLGETATTASFFATTVGAAAPTTTTTTSSSTAPATASWKPFQFSSSLQLQEFLKTEQDNLIGRLTRCIEQPEATWLQADKYPLGTLDTVDSMTIEPIVEALCKAQRMMMLEQDEEVLEGLRNAPSAVITYQLLDSLKDGKLYVDRITIEAKRTGSPILVGLLEQELLHGPADDSDMAVLLRLDQLEQGAKALEELDRLGNQRATAFEDATSATTTTTTRMPDITTGVVEENKTFQDKGIFGKFPWQEKNTEPTVPATRNSFVDVMPEVMPATKDEPRQRSWSTTPVQDLTVELKVVRNNMKVVHEDDNTMVSEAAFVAEGTTATTAAATFMAELVSDDDFDDAFETTVKRAVAVSGEEFDEDGNEIEAKPGLLVRMALRSFDVVFFVIEKTVTVGEPKRSTIFAFLTLVEAFGTVVGINFCVSPPIVPSE